MDGHGTTWHRNIAENFNRLKGAPTLQTDDRQTDGRRRVAHLNSRSLKMKVFFKQ